MNKAHQMEIDLPDKKYYTIGEVSEICQLKSHVLRYWEQVFPQLNPNKRRGRRYYQKQDLVLLLEIKTLLHEQGFTISGAKSRLSQTIVQIDTTESTEPKMNENSHTIPYQSLVDIKQQLQHFRNYIQENY
jgi:DNA-binding transcriptional MerR regulator